MRQESEMARASETVRSNERFDGGKETAGTLWVGETHERRESRARAIVQNTSKSPTSLEACVPIVRGHESWYFCIVTYSNVTMLLLLLLERDVTKLLSLLSPPHTERPLLRDKLFPHSAGDTVCRASRESSQIDANRFACVFFYNTLLYRIKEKRSRRWGDKREKQEAKRKSRKMRDMLIPSLRE